VVPLVIVLLVSAGAAIPLLRRRNRASP
jgi:hypothetical protein